MTEREEDLRDRSLLERTLGVFTEVRAGEGITALLLTLNVFLLLTAYYVIKPVRDSLIVNSHESGAELKAYMGGAIAIALLGAVPAYGWVAARLKRNRLLVGVSLFFVSNLVLFYFASLMPAMAQKGTPALIFALVFFVWVGIFNMMIIAQFWAFANDVYTPEQGKRLFPLVGLGASVGAAVGSLVVASLVKKLGSTIMFLVCAVLLGLSAFLIQMVHTRETHREQQEKDGPAASTQAEKRDDTPLSKSGKGAFALVFSNRYLLLLAAFSLVFTLVNTNGEYIVGRLVKDWSIQLSASGLSQEEVENQGTAFYGSFYLWVNVVGVLLQSFVVSRIIKFGGLRVAFFILPVIAFADALAIAVMPILMIARLGKIAENSVDYSLNNTLRNMLWLPTTREMKYLAKQAVDTFFVRMGDVGSALAVYVLAALLGFGVRAMAVTNLVLIVVWLVLAAAIVRENAALTRKRESLPPGEAEPAT